MTPGPKIYIVAWSEPKWPSTAPRVTLDDAREQVAKINTRFPNAPPVRVWRVERDGSYAEVKS